MSLCGRRLPRSPYLLFHHRNIKFNYCILDEGHVIKNGKTKLSKAIKQIAANFRVILSGTPIQVRARHRRLLGVELNRSVDVFSLGVLRTTSWSSGPCSTSSCRASWEQNGSLPLATGNQSWPAETPRAPRENRKQACWLLFKMSELCCGRSVRMTVLSSLGVLAMEALHRQVLPFLLRRMKEDVLQDLPPKIIQDYYCNLSPLQVSFSPGCESETADAKL